MRFKPRKKKVNNEILRSLEIIDFAKHKDVPIHIIGMGAVGSRVFEQLACLGVSNVQCYDFDVIEPHNINNQLFCMEDVGKPKVAACMDWYCKKFGITTEQDLPHNMGFHNTTVEQDDIAKMSGIILSCLDTFDGRRMIIQGAVESGKVSSVIEGRCAPSFHKVHTVNPFDAEQVTAFMETLGDDDADDPYVSICGLPINFAPVMIACATNMVLQTINFLNQGTTFENQRKVTFFSEPMLVLGSQTL